jgi:transcriptional regulator with XRE-family HTH domain
VDIRNRPRYPRPTRSVALDLAVVRGLRTERGLSFTELAKLVGYSDVHVGQVEAGRQGASPAYAKALAKALLGREDRLYQLLKSGS